MVSDMEITRSFITATTEVMATMAGMDIIPGTPQVKHSARARGDISAIVGVTGFRKGSIAISFSREVAVSLARAMLGDDIHDLETDIQDAAGEVVNMISGQARANLANKGMNLQGSTPTVIAGPNHMVRQRTSAEIVIIPFSTPDGEFTVEFCLE